MVFVFGNGVLKQHKMLPVFRFCVLSVGWDSLFVVSGKFFLA